MAQRVVVRQDIDFETEFLAQAEKGELRIVENIRDIDPYGMLLAGLGACAAVAVNTYARYHGVPLKEAEFRLSYERTFKKDCERCEDIRRYDEKIMMAVSFSGELTDEQRQKLFRISLQCPIHKMFEDGIGVKTWLEKEVLGKK